MSALPQSLATWAVRLFNATLQSGAIHPDLREVILEEFDEMLSLREKRLEYVRGWADNEALTLNGMRRFKRRMKDLPVIAIDPHRCPASSPETCSSCADILSGDIVKEEEIDHERTSSTPPAPINMEQLANLGRQRSYLDLNKYFAEHASSSALSSTIPSTVALTPSIRPRQGSVEPDPTSETPQDPVFSHIRSSGTALPNPSRSITKEPFKGILKSTNKKRSRDAVLAEDANVATDSGESFGNGHKDAKRARIEEENTLSRRQKARPLRRSYAFRLD